MSNLAKGQTAWNKLARELGFYLGAIKLWRDVERKHDLLRNRIQLVGENLEPTIAVVKTLTGVVIGTNTDEDGLLWVDTAPSGADQMVKLYKSSAMGAGDLVAQTALVTPPATASALVAQNSSGLGGTVDLVDNSAYAASSTDTWWRVRVFPDLPRRADDLFDGSEPEHSTLKAGSFAACAQARALALQAIAVWVTALTAFLQTRWASFNRSSQSSALRAEPVDDQGAISVLYTGLLEDARDNMADETSPAAQTVLKRTVTAGSPTEDASNQGDGTMSAPTMEEWAQDGLVTLVCTDATIGAEKFTLTQTLDDVPGTSLAAVSRLQVGRTFADPVLGIRSALLSRAIALTAGSTNDFGAGSYWSFSGESASNTNDGVIYLKVIASGGSWYIEGYKASTYASDQKVFTSAVGAAGATVVLSAANGSGLTGSGKIGAAPTTTNTGTLDLKTFRTQNTNGVPDKITIDVTASAGGEFQRRIAELFGYALNSASSSETLDDSYVSAGTFPPYVVTDA